MKKLNKKCSKCNKKKSINHFRINNQMKCGYDSWCKECDNQCALEYYYKNKQYILKKKTIVYNSKTN